MSYQPIENYGIIGNMRTVALVGMNGSYNCDTPGHYDFCRPPSPNGLKYQGAENSARAE
jgi:hypothetical protein